MTEPTRFDTIRTDRLLMRRWRESDREPFAALNADPETMQFFPETLGRAASDAHVDAIESRFDRLGYGLWALEVVETGEFIGVTGLHGLSVRHRHVQFGISIGVKAMWGKGYGTEAAQLLVRHAFQTLNLNRVQLDVYEFNQKAIRCYEKAGFQIEGRLRESFFAEGRYWDTLVMGILRSEWRPEQG